jgi:hypothetical protein
MKKDSSERAKKAYRKHLEKLADNILKADSKSLMLKKYKLNLPKFGDPEDENV